MTPSIRDLITIVEAFDTPLPYEWTMQTGSRWAASFEIDGLQYGLSLGFVEEDEAWHAIYFQNHKGRFRFLNTDNVGSKTLRVLSTIVAAMKDFIIQVHPEHPIIFDASKANGDKNSKGRVTTSDRDSVYSRMLGRMWGEINALGYRVAKGDNGSMTTKYAISPKEPSSPAKQEDA